MPLPRTPEPPPPDAAAEAAEYQAMDHSAVNARFVDELLAGGEIGKQVIDLGCGPAQIPIELCRRVPDVTVMAIDGDPHMLDLAKMEIDMAGMLERILLQHADACDLDEFDDEMADAVISNSLLHHLDHPQRGLESAARLLRPGGRLFIRDLARPESEQAVEQLVAAYAGQESRNAQQLLRQSLHAALTIDEIVKIAGGLGIAAQHVQMTSDRHWTIDWRS